LKLIFSRCNFNHHWFRPDFGKRWKTQKQKIGVERIDVIFSTIVVTSIITEIRTDVGTDIRTG
jgi:hypothetical protein